ncbi:MAG: ATP-binding protein [Desulfobacteraceae bacterium]|jgi:signal transduction histidine kinase
MDMNEHMELDDFDREYGLIDLMPSALAAEVLGSFNGNVHFAILLPNGGCYFNGDGTKTTFLNDAAPKIAQEGSALIRSNVGGEATMVFPLTHEMDTVGFLVVQQKQPNASFDLMALGRFAVVCIERMMHLNYRLRLTSGLHGQVVQESYASLKEKASQLQASEARYRSLAQNLEVEVKHKTEEIKTTQLAMLQQEKLASIGQLAAGMAHEINNPIGFIISNLVSLERSMSDLLNLIEQYDGFIHAWEKVDSAKQAHETLHGKVEAIRQLQHELDLDFLKEDSKALIAESLEGGARIRSIVQDLREFSHPSVKTQEGVDFNHCLDTTLSMLSGKIRNGVCIQKDYADLPVVTCYLREMNQVFYNIMLNALQVIGPQGQLILSTRACGDGWVEVGISDTGPGIPARSMARIFEPFYTTRQVGEGIGLGLYLAYNIVKSHNGTIVVESKEGGGSTFRVKIPVEGSKA